MLILGMAERAAQHLLQLVVLDKMLHFICMHLLVFIFRNTLGFCNQASFQCCNSTTVGKRNSSMDAGFLLEHCPHVSPGLGGN